jgi:hypothetical protein
MANEYPNRNYLENAPVALPGGGGSALGALASIPGDAALQAALMAAIVASGAPGVATVALSAAQFAALSVTPVEIVPALAGFTPELLSAQAIWTVTGAGATGGNWELRFSNGQLVNIGALGRNGNLLGTMSWYSTPNVQTFGIGQVPLNNSIRVTASAATAAVATASVSIVYRYMPNP